MSGERRITLQISPQEAFNEIFMCVFVWVAKGAACACTWHTALLKLRSQLIEKEEKFEEEKTTTTGRGRSYRIAECKERRKMSFDWSIRGGMPHFYRGRNSRWYGGSEETSSHDLEEKEDRANN